MGSAVDDALNEHVKTNSWVREEKRGIEANVKYVYVCGKGWSCFFFFFQAEDGIRDRFT